MYCGEVLGKVSSDATYLCLTFPVPPLLAFGRPFARFVPAMMMRPLVAKLVVEDGQRKSLEVALTRLGSRGKRELREAFTRSKPQYLPAFIHSIGASLD